MSINAQVYRKLAGNFVQDGALSKIMVQKLSSGWYLKGPYW